MMIPTESRIGSLLDRFSFVYLRALSFIWILKAGNPLNPGLDSILDHSHLLTYSRYLLFSIALGYPCNV